MKKLIVHMGAHRCASSATQALLRRNRADIEASGVALLLRDELVAETHGVAMNRFYDYRFWHPLRRRDVAVTRRALAHIPQDTVLVSEENLMGIMPGHLRAGFYSGFGPFCQALAVLKRDVEVHPRLVVRRQDRLIESIYGFRVAFGLRDDFGAFIAPFYQMDLSWLRLATTLQRTGFSDTARIDVLEAWPRSVDATDHVLRFLGLEGLALDGGGLRHGNSRFDEPVLEVLLAMNRCALGLDMGWRRDVLFPALRKADGPVFELVQELLCLGGDEASVLKAALAVPSRFRLTDAERSHFLASTQEDNVAFLKHPLVQVDAGCWA